ncbi:uncharacterized protein BJX67DRAFT_379720 [Aspergillus lucknowensis]|uniref:DUF6314 domain-containing protein n=1 Tax=Aspergillus lucknowensis TaxID=176173 RepID=A0ABR4LWJ1_9EURO
MTSTQEYNSHPQTETAMPPPPALPRNLLPTLFSSLARPTRGPVSSTPTRWTLRRTLKSENPNDITGDLHGSAVFTPLRPPPPPTSTSASTSTPRRAENAESNTNADIDTDTHTHTGLDKPEEKYKDGQEYTELLYSEEGLLPTSFGPGLRWTKKYIWRLGTEGGVSVWFVKVDKKGKSSSSSSSSSAEKEEEEEEADYLFHEFDFLASLTSGLGSELESTSTAPEEFVTPPVPPDVESWSERKTRVIAARGNHLCVNDMYRTAYAFRVDEGSGEVVSWASRHVVRGPKKGQDIVNLYSRE